MWRLARSFGETNMANTYTSTRRDPRFELRKGSSFVVFSDPKFSREHGEAELTRISASGLAFRTEREPDLAIGTVIKGATIQVGGCRVAGELVVRSIEPTKESTTEVGCLFYPRGPGMPETLLAIISGMEALLAAS